MHPPIIVVDDDIYVYETVESAERGMEAWQLRRPGLKIFDRDGRPVRAVIVEKRFWTDIVKLEEEEGAEPQPEELRSILVRFLSHVDDGAISSHQDMSLGQLLSRALKHKTR